MHGFHRCWIWRPRLVSPVKKSVHLLYSKIQPVKNFYPILLEEKFGLQSIHEIGEKRIFYDKL